MTTREIKYQTSLHIFRRDLRLEDNTALLQALTESQQVIPCFIFDPDQVDRNKYKSEHCIQFMLESLRDLESSLEKLQATLYLFYDKPLKVLTNLIKQIKIDAIYFNRDYTPFSLKRDSEILTFCKNNGIACHDVDDALLSPPSQILKSDGTPYTVFTAYYHKAILNKVSMPQKNKYKNYCTQKITGSLKLKESQFIRNFNERLAQHGGRMRCLKRLKEFVSNDSYKATRDYPADDSTSKISAHLKFNTCSVREIFHFVSSNMNDRETFIKELIWRDFFTQIAFYFPFVFGHAFHKKYDRLGWEYDKEKFQRWCQGETGFPIVDAGMRQLNETGFMHNRVRMITASFLIKDLHIDWRMGEAYFAQKLVDYDPAVNNGNWQWVASTGCDAQPFFRIFNPWLQQKKYDRDAEYIKQWIPELRTVPVKSIHKIYEQHILGYPAPLVDHQHESKVAKNLYQKVR